MELSQLTLVFIIRFKSVVKEYVVSFRNVCDLHSAKTNFENEANQMYQYVK